MAYRATSTHDLGTLTSAIERSFRCRRLDGLSRHLDPGACTLTSATKHSCPHRRLRGSSRHFDPAAATLTSAMKHPSPQPRPDGLSRHRDRLQHVDICDSASVLQPLPRELIASFSATSTR
jgi:hypothetical protein